MRPRRPGPRTAGRPDQGFTLVEVIVAIVLLALVSVGVLGLFIRAVKDSAGLARRQAAVAVAQQSMELARSISPTRDSSGNSPLISGRTQPAVSAQWAAATAADLTQIDQAWDSTATGSSTPALPLTSANAVGAITYTATNLVGTCWQPPVGGACVTSAAKVASSRQLYRVIVLVTWSSGAGSSCSGTACSYSLASLIDPAPDSSFNVNATNAAWPAAPVLTPISATTALNTAVTVDLATSVLSAGTPLTATLGSPTQGATVSLLPNTTTVTVTPATGFTSGASISLPFTLTDPYGQSASTTLSVTVSPPLTAANGTASTWTWWPVTIDLSAFDSGGVAPFSYTTTKPAWGTFSSVSGSNVTVTPWSGGAHSFSYTVTDAAGHTATGSITLTAW